MGSITRPLSIIIGVNGIGMGHTVRQLELACYLRERGHEIRVVTSGARVAHFRGQGFHAYDSWMPTLIARGDRIRIADAIRANASAMLGGWALYRHLCAAIADGGIPDVVVSDYEPNAARLARHFGRPLISIDQQSKYRHFDFPPIAGYSRRSDEQRLRWFAPKKKRSFVCSFVPLRAPAQDIEIIPPIVPDQIRRATVRSDPCVTAYFSRYFGHGPMASTRDLAEIFRDHLPGLRLRIYAQDSDFPALRRYGGRNVSIHAFDRGAFIADTARSQAVFSNAGFNLISEALVLGKPLHLVPLPTYDQYWCAQAVERAGFGRQADRLHAADVLNFLAAGEEMSGRIRLQREALRSDPRPRIADYLESIGPTPIPSRIHAPDPRAAVTR
jgi:uncharacterized protein (TIGR00661 family)